LRQRLACIVERCKVLADNLAAEVDGNKAAGVQLERATMPLAETAGQR
jgi:hypothetical protein